MTFCVEELVSVRELRNWQLHESIYSSDAALLIPFCQNLI